jgi:isoquinoline 1-oxidoreductase beta subunit
LEPRSCHELQITFADDKAQQTTFHAYQGMRIYKCPEIQVRTLENAPKVREAGEPLVPPVFANAIFVAMGTRLREMLWPSTSSLSEVRTTSF